MNPNAVFEKNILGPTNLPQDTKIRLLGLADLENLQQFWGTQYCDVDWLFLPSKSVLCSWLSCYKTKIWGYCVNKELHGTLMLRILQKGILSVDCICVHRMHRRKGITATMLQHMLNDACSLGWLRVGYPFSILGQREAVIPFSLHYGFVKPLRYGNYYYLNGKSNLTFTDAKQFHVIQVNSQFIKMFNTQRITYPERKQQWEVTEISDDTILDLVAAHIPATWQLWVPSYLFKDEPREFIRTDAYAIQECWGRPVTMQSYFTHY